VPERFVNGLIEKLTQLFHEELDLEFDSIDQDLIEKGLLISLHLVEVLYILEQEFGFEISILEIDFDTFRSVRSIAQFEIDVCRERQPEGIAKAKIAGVYTGRKAGIDRRRELEPVSSGQGPAAFARAVKVSRMSVYRMPKEAGA